MRNNASDHSARNFPFFTHELAGNPLFVHASTDECLQRGWYPPLFDRPFIPSDWYEPYVALYLEKDLSRLINIKDLSQFHKFISLCAGERFSFWHAPSAGEVDLVVEQGNDIRAIEIKSSASFRGERVSDEASCASDFSEKMVWIGDDTPFDRAQYVVVMKVEHP